MTWNYRVCVDPAGHHSVREVYYDNEDKPTSWTGALDLNHYGDEYEILADLKLMLIACDEPVFEIPEDGGDDFDPN